MQEIKICPFRIHREKRFSATVEGEYFENEWFMKCVKQECPAFHIRFDNVAGAPSKYAYESCRRLEK